MKRLLIILFIIMFWVGMLQADILTWNENTESDLSGYTVYWRSEGDNFNSLNSFWVVVNEFCIDDHSLDEVYFAVSASDFSSNESGVSEELWYKWEDDFSPAVPSGLQIIKNTCKLDINNDGRVTAIDIGMWRTLMQDEFGRGDCLIN